MRALFITLLCCYNLLCSAQGDSTSNLTYHQWADSIYGALNAYVPTGHLYNRALEPDTTLSTSWNTDVIRTNTAEGGTFADHMYSLIYEQQLMAFDSSEVLDRLQLFELASAEIIESEFQYEEYYYPIGVLDYRFEYLNETANVLANNIVKSGDQWQMIGTQLDLVTKNAALIGPLFDQFDSDTMALVFRKKYFLSNYRDSSAVLNIQLTHNTQVFNLNWDQLYRFAPYDSVVQIFTVEITYSDSSKIKGTFSINTPELGLKIKKSSNSFPGCDREGEERLDNTPIDMKLNWCMIGRCDYNGRVLKPYMLLTGYRPPLIGQTFKKTWKIYNDWHKELLENLVANNFDVFIVKFNIHMTPYSQGMIQSSKLLEKFILSINQLKGEDGHENVIQGSSMSADIARLTLLDMEKKHFEDPTYPHHHTRLFISYDANFYGANIPLGYQYQIYSDYNYGSPTICSSCNIFLGTFLYATMQQKTVKELLMYHASATDPNIFSSAHYDLTCTPTHHPKRQEYYDALSLSDNHLHIFPMPAFTRNVAISLGHISLSNNIISPEYNDPGEYWINNSFGLYQFKIGAAKYMPNNQNFLLFQRKKTFFPQFHHEVHVNKMLEIDNASGSFLEGSGNIISVANWAYYTIINFFNGKDYFSHKAVVTALGINKDIWPQDGSMTLNLHDLKLMYKKFSDVPILLQSNHFGYPNLGRPTDHFEVTPFEAIYVDRKINPHIILSDDNQNDLDSLNLFIMTEVEPYYLGLQNLTIGSQARPDYLYYSYRRAKNQIITGNLVTPTTDPGDFVVNPNGKLTLKAGDKIILKSGTTFKNGSTVYIKPEYEECNDFKSSNLSPSNDDSVSDIDSLSSSNVVKSFLLYPNPSSRIVSIQQLGENKLDYVEIRNFSGKLVFEGVNFNREIDISAIEPGIYFVKCSFNGNVETHKLIISR